MKNRLRKDDLLFQILVNSFLLTVLLAIAVPIWRVFMMSVTPLGYLDDKTFGLWIPPWTWSFEAYKQLFNHPAFLQAASNSAFITLVGMSINMLLTIPLAYALSNRNLPGTKICNWFHPGTFPVPGWTHSHIPRRTAYGIG